MLYNTNNIKRFNTMMKHSDSFSTISAHSLSPNSSQDERKSSIVVPSRRLTKPSLKNTEQRNFNETNNFRLRNASSSTTHSRSARNSESSLPLEEQVDNDLILKLKTTFTDVIESSPAHKGDVDIVEMIKSQFDTQTVRIRRLEKALSEKEVLKDDQDTLALLQKRYPKSMELFKRQVEEQLNQQLEICIKQFEAQKQQMIQEHQENFRLLKLKYRNRFEDIVERMISDPSRLDDEWARRVQQEADDRVEKLKQSYFSDNSKQ